MVWLIFTVLGVACFGGRSHQCAALASAQGYPGCGVAEGATTYTSATACRYAAAPLPVPYGVVPGVTSASGCGCAVVDGVPVFERSERTGDKGEVLVEPGETGRALVMLPWS